MIRVECTATRVTIAYPARRSGYEPDHWSGKQQASIPSSIMKEKGATSDTAKIFKRGRMAVCFIMAEETRFDAFAVHIQSRIGVCRSAAFRRSDVGVTKKNSENQFYLSSFTDEGTSLLRETHPEFSGSCNTRVGLGWATDPDTHSVMLEVVQSLGVSNLMRLMGILN
ncbi:hypothetical protein M413DRAFT_431484 [Hebeloma cylindrosporum]|uniref:Uncharacterized protein n=1 Tax=Hebeloma cylindrosporum TaxID=76867 RepID=A0A0C3C6E1_HEBCY|nr:hypothetical protein M413DRAFT_431484 [Hebeloma cylindrosporum h7]